MPKVSSARNFLYEKWFLIIQYIDQSVDPKKEIQNHFKKDQVWVYQKNHKTVSIEIKVFSCLTLVNLVQKLENTEFAVGNVESKITSKTSGLARVLKGQRKNYGGWFLSIKK